MSKCRINKYKSFTCASGSGSGTASTGLDKSLAATLAARDTQDSTLWASPKESQMQSAIVKVSPVQSRTTDIDTILGGDF